ncbi:hypothetical protein BCR32DRAFT_290389 [Anaeromyces robustus]|uniref:C2 domain-containing protein n=1 Tax=Anaeromyces robustus TaxID=1754192 RepID=A0A1Y1XJJ3_9FUNG|nr:hypothetical protein BCR32DRAFT_290389 [Anaeromyces robustus]|eukprot:ORX85927.1 hypothetical protein BCR32DRAFT_290389 [Anaeromyces robustus]
MIRKGLPPPRTVGSPLPQQRGGSPLPQQRGQGRPNDYYDNYSRSNPNSPMIRNAYDSPRFANRQPPPSGRMETSLNPPRYGEERSTPHLRYGEERSTPHLRYGEERSTPQLRYREERSTPQLRYGDERQRPMNRPERPERRYRPPVDDGYLNSGSAGRHDLERSTPQLRYGEERSTPQLRYGEERSRPEYRERPPQMRSRSRHDPERERGRYNERDYNNHLMRSKSQDPNRLRPRRDASRGRGDYPSPALASPSLQHSKSQGNMSNSGYRGRPPRLASDNRSHQDSDSSSTSSSRSEDRSVRSTASTALSDLLGQFENDLDAALSETFSSSSKDSPKYLAPRNDKREREAREKRERERIEKERERQEREKEREREAQEKEAREKEAREKEAREREAREREAREKEAREKEALEREAREREAREREAREREAREREAREREAREREAREREAREREAREKQEKLRNNNDDFGFDLPKPQRVGVTKGPELPRPVRNQSSKADKVPSRPPRQESNEAMSNNASPLSPRPDMPIGRSVSSVGRLSRSASKNVGPHRGRVPPPVPVAVMPSDIADVTENDQDVDTLTISSKYRDHFIDYLISQEYTDPTEDDFVTLEGYYMWEETTDNRPFPDVLAQLVDHRFSKEWIDEQNRKIEERKKAQQPNTTLRTNEPTVKYTMVIKVVRARGILAKEGKTRNPYCEMNFDGSTFHTEKCDNTLEPYWNQHLEIKIKDITENITLKIWDKKAKGKFWKKDDDEFLGMISISMGELINRTARSGYFSQWYNLNKRPDKKDKYAGGQILIEATEGDTTNTSNEKSMSNRQEQQMSDYELLQSQLVNCKVSFKKLYTTLLKSCLEHDLNYVRPDIDGYSITSEILSDEAKILLKIFGKKWIVGDAFQVISYLEQVFIMHQSNKVPIHVVVATFDVLRDSMKTEGWLPAYERPHLIDLLDQMESFHSKQVCHYREYFPKDQPEGALQNALLLWRMIFKNRIFKQQHPDLPESFREEIGKKILEHVENRYTKLLGLSSPFVETTEDILNGLAKLADLIVEDIEDDLKYYHVIFSQEVNIVRVSAETYLKNFIQELENNSERIASPEAVEASKATFELYNRVKLMDKQYAKLVPGLKRLSIGSGFNVEKWFKEFVTSWLKAQQDKTIEWVKNAIDSDKLERISEDIPHSSSVVDLFSIMFEELELIRGLEWSDVDQYTEFVTTFSKIVTKAIEQYCDSLQSGEIKKDEGGNKMNPLLAAAFGIESENHQPTDIANESCVKLCNIEEALLKLDEMYKLIQEQNIKKVKETKSTNVRAADGTITGTFGLEIVFGENIKPCNKNGLSSPYVLVKLPDGTPIPIGEDGVPVQQTLELARSSVVYDSVNPIWDETFQISLLPTKTIEILVYNKTSFLTSDELCGKKVVRLSSGWCDHQTHDIWIKLEPQGRLLIRITMDGEGEDIDFFFKNARQRLMRARIDFVRALVNRISPIVREILTKACKDNEAAPLPNKSIFSLTKSYSNLTPSGKPIDAKLTSQEAEEALLPLTEYLDKNLETLCSSLSSKMAQEVIFRTWSDILVILENLMVPQMYGAVERDRRILNPRQINYIEVALDILFDFFHAEGEGLGLPKSTLRKVPKYRDINVLINNYSLNVEELKKEYEKSNKLQILKLIRLYSQVGEDATQKEEARVYLEKELDNLNSKDEN